jgi:hypothetical protein
LFAIFLLSLIGVPLTGGFFGKFYIFKAALDANLVWLTILGLLNSAVAAYYYLRILVVMYMKERLCRFLVQRPGARARRALQTLFSRPAAGHSCPASKPSGAGRHVGRRGIREGDAWPLNSPVSSYYSFVCDSSVPPISSWAT